MLFFPTFILAGRFAPGEPEEVAEPRMNDKCEYEFHPVLIGSLRKLLSAKQTENQAKAHLSDGRALLDNANLDG